MNSFYLETWHSAAVVVMYILSVISVISLLLAIWAFRHRHEEKVMYDQSPTYVGWMALLIVCSIFLILDYTCNFTETALVNKTYELTDQRRHLTYGPCYREQNLGCPKMWAQYRADSIWLESMLAKFKE